MALQFTVFHALLDITLTLSFAAAVNVGLRSSYDCACPGDDILYECTVPDVGATVWRGEAFDCPNSNDEIYLSNGIDSTRECNNGDISGSLTRAQLIESFHTSQLTVRVSPDTNNTTIECLHDNGAGNLAEVGSTVLTITTDPLPPPNDLYLVKMNHGQLVFEWIEVTSNCPIFHYRITSTNCGQCPDSTRNTTATCTGNFTTSSLGPCLFAVQSSLCGNISGDARTTTASPIIGFSGTNIDPSNATPSDTECKQGITVISGTIIGSLCLVNVLIITIFIAVLMIVIKSKRALRQQFNALKSKVDQQPVIYEEIPQLQGSLKSSTPSIETGDNSAYTSTVPSGGSS